MAAAVRPVLRVASQRGILRLRYWSLDMDFASRPPHFDDELVKRRRAQEEFIARGLRSSEDARRTGSYHQAKAVHGELQQRLDTRRKLVLG